MSSPCPGHLAQRSFLALRQLGLAAARRSWWRWAHSERLRSGGSRRELSNPRPAGVRRRHFALVAGVPGSDPRDYRDSAASIEGSSVADSIIGDSGNQTLHGNGGNDDLNGAGGDDLLIGGAGDDRYVFAGNWGADRVDTSDDVASSVEMLEFSDIADASGLRLYRYNSGLII